MAESSDSVPETLDSSLSVDDRIIEDQNQSSSSTSPSSSTAASPSTSDPTLLRSASSSRLNAKAPEFVPRSSSSPSMPRVDMTQPQAKPMHAISTPQAPPPGLLHVYPGPNPGFRLPVHGGHMAVPAQNNHHPYPHHVQVQFQQHHNNRHRPQYIPVGFVEPQDVQQQATVEPDYVPAPKNGISEESCRKIVNQVEYYFSDINLATTDHLIRFINKDADGFVPMSVVGSFKKIKALISSNSQLAGILRNSTKLVVSEDGKRIRRQHPLTESDMEELQSRIVVAENLPEDHCHSNLMKIFSAVGSVKTIRTCQPQTSNGGASSASRSGKADSILYSNKLHAFVEYESVEIAEKAVAELNDKANWRNGLRLRLLLKRTAKSAQTRGKKYGLEGDANNFEEDEISAMDHLNEKQHFEASPHQSDAQFYEYGQVEERGNEKDGGLKKGQGRGRGRGKGRNIRGQYNNNHQHQNNHRGSHHHHIGGGTPPHLNSNNNNIVNNGGEQHQQQSFAKQQPPGPRMPDGTRGFSMGRGKPFAAAAVNSAA